MSWSASTSFYMSRSSVTNEMRIEDLSQALVTDLLRLQKTVSTAESCTGGWIAKAITDIAGSSGCFGHGVVSYSNAAKESLLGVNAATLRAHGAVSEETVLEMAEGSLTLSGADLAVAVSGIAGPDGGSDEKPVGTVWFGWASRGIRNDGDSGAIAASAERHRFGGDREQVRSRAVAVALQGLRQRAGAGG